MQNVNVDDAGTQLGYIDSGAPSGNSYTTLVCVHGHSYHAQNFSRLFPLSAKYNLRVIALNRRDYVGSTPFSESELDILKDGTDEAKEQFMRTRGLEIARFLVWLVKELNIPPASEDGKSGGIALLGWSLGNITTMAFLGNLSSYAEDITETLEPYLRTFFIYDLPNNCLGYSRPEGYYHPLEDTSIHERIRGIQFGKWVSSYYEHPAYTAGPDSYAQNHTKSVFPRGSRSIDALQLRAPKKAARPCTLDKLSPRDLLSCVDIAPGTRSEWAMWRLPPSVLHAQKSKALISEYDTGANDNSSQPLAKLQIRVLCGLASLWVVQWETWAFEEEYLKWRDEGKEVRSVKFIPVEEANHFMHWDDPETFLKLCSENMKS
ncbi:hypothetical protein ACEPAI_6131 [Sanghuangporus weigelae]